MSEGFDTAGSITAKGPISGVTVHSHMRSGPHSVMADQLDLVLIVELMYLLAEQARRDPAEQPAPVTPQSLLVRLRELGVKSGNGSRLVGRDAVYESFARLRAKGYIRRISAKDGLNKHRGVSYEFYEFPAWNPAPPALAEEANSASSQVGATSGNAGSGIAGSGSGNRTSRKSSQVGATSGIAGSGNAGSKSGARVSSQVGATSGNAGSPPHPPEEVTTSSPTPHADTDGRHSLPSQTGGRGEFSPKEIYAAESFLQRMKKPWNAGKATAEACAPKLLAVMAAQGWPSIFDVDKKMLEQDIAKNPQGVTRFASVIPKRIADLSLYEVVAPAPRQMPAPRPNEPERGPVSTESITSLLDALEGPSI